MSNEAVDSGINERDFRRVRQMLYDIGGISLNDSKMSLASGRLAKRLRVLGISSYAKYLDHVEQSDDEREHFINALTTNLTSFFREEHHFDELAKFLKKQPANRPLTIWSSAASTGEEPYSIAMTVIEALGEKAAPRVQVIASDLDTQVLAKGKAGIYPMERLEKISKERRQRFFMQGAGRNTGMVRVKSVLQNMVSFLRINLLEANWPLPQKIDIIFCRNVMIYFDKSTQLKILERFVPLMPNDGLLFAGHSESYTHAAHLLQTCGKTMYRLADKRPHSG